MKKQQSKRVIPGFGLTMGVTLAMLSIVVLIPLASLAVYYRICGHGGECHHGTDPCVGAGAV